VTSAIGLGLFVATCAGALYLAIACARLAAFTFRPCALASEFLPSITIIKPVAGLEWGLSENLASFCDQEYDGFFEVIFCLHDRTDAASTVVERIIERYPRCDAKMVFGNNAALVNPKIANIAKPGVAPQGEIVVIADSDIRVGRTYLRALAASFESQGTGAATCLYAGVPNQSLISRLGALGIEDGFAPSVLVATAIGELRFALGATMAARARVLAEFGGLAALGETLADDHRLGQLVASRGYRIELLRYPVSTVVPETRLAALWSHELRWARTHFSLARAGYAMSFLMYALPLALFYLAVSRNLAWGLPLLALVLTLRVALHYLARKALRTTRDDVWLIPLRDFFSLGVWAASLFGRRRTFR
jgi:ceramide glucosyltransferase